MKTPNPQRKVKSDDLTTEELMAIKGLVNNDGWLALQKVIKKNISYLKRQILDDDDLSYEIRISQRDLVRQWLKLNKRLLVLPETLTNHNEDDGEARPIRLDPYAETMSELRSIHPPIA